MASKDRTNARPVAARSSSRPKIATASAGNHDTSNGQEETDEADESANPSKEDGKEADVYAPSAIAALPVNTPSKQSRELLAGLQLRSDVKNSMPPPSNKPSRKKQANSDNDAISQKMSELEAQGWQPDEEDYGIADDDDYDAVDMISDSEDDDNTMRKREEKSIFGNRSREEENDLARRLSLCSNATDDIDFAGFDNFDFDPAQAIDPTQVRSIGKWLDIHFDSRRTSFDDVSQDVFTEDSVTSNAGQSRRVRFQDEVDMSDLGSSDSEPDNETFPDLFGDAHPNHSPAMHQLTNSMQFDDGSDAGSCWDFDGDQPIDLEEDDTSNSSATSDGNDCRFEGSIVVSSANHLMKPMRVIPLTKKCLPLLHRPPFDARRETAHRPLTVCQALLEQLNCVRRRP